MNLLHVDSSILGANSVSRQLSAAVVERLTALTPGLAVQYRDLAAEPLSHLSADYLAAGQGAVPQSPSFEADFIEGQTALQQFLDADVVVIGAPMYNFSVPSQLKAWIDRLSVVGKTFRYTESGPEGLAGGKRLIVVSSRGGFYEGTPAAALDHQESYLRAVFGFFGITDITVIQAEGVSRGAAQRAQAIEAALTAVGFLSVTPQSTAA